MHGINEILIHPWFNKIKISDYLEKRISPPVIPDILNFNFNE